MSEQDREKSSVSGQDIEQNTVSGQDSVNVHKNYGAGLVIESRDWYRDRFRQTMIIAMIVTALLAGSLIANTIQAVTQPRPKYFAITDDLRIKRLQPLDKPTLSQSGLFNWITRKVTATFSLDFVHWRKNLMDVKPDYTEKAFGQLIDSLKGSGNLEMIKKKRLVLSATVTRSPVVKAKGVVNGRMTWKLEFPVTLSYESSDRVVSSQDLMCNVMVHRVSTLKHPRGIRIAQLIMK